MKSSESKYYNTALLMNQALIELLNKKDFEFISVKEICKKAGVNRSTFYLHYDTVADLLQETIDNLNKKFFECFPEQEHDITQKIMTNKNDELIFITPKFLLPYLRHVKENKTVYIVSAKYPALMQSELKYKYLRDKILFPIFQLFNIEEKNKKFVAAYYVRGTYAIIEEWIKGGCSEDVNMICDIIIGCVRPYKNENGNKTTI